MSGQEIRFLMPILCTILSRFPFIVSLVITKDLLAFCKGISVKLQSRSIDIVKAHNEVEDVLATLKETRDDVDQC